MATRRRVGVSNATTEAARRQLMQPVVCWEKVWSKPENVPTGSLLKVFKWVKTDKIPHFEDENQVDAPLAPLPDEPEVVEIEEEEESQPVVGEKAQADATEVSETIQEPEDSKPPSPKPQLMMSTESTMEDITDTGDGLDASLNPMDTSGMGGEKMSTEGMDLDLSALGPDGLALVDVGDLSQIEVEDGLMGGPNMDDTIDPFAAESTITMDEK